ncbi:AraD1 family protein [Halalkalibaculum sp. DA3122]|uniref:AraD1 family protein n=1 Tax=unclassified Halalkalibaculum TaxID=2964617 RepID=UPI0037549C1F
MRLIQFKKEDSNRCVGVVEDGEVYELHTVSSTYDLFHHSAGNQVSLREAAQELMSSIRHPYTQLVEEGRILLPLDHPDPYHIWITGTGLTHTGSAESRDKMHRELKESDESELTDSMRMYRMGWKNGVMEGEKPASQPEWFYKGNGLMATPPYEPIRSPGFALDGGEEPEIAGLYIIDPDGKPQRLGFALSNDFSDHKMEQINYLYLAHSKLRPCSYGPELLTGPLPKHITGRSRIYRNDEVLWEREFLTGEDNMTHNIANIEHHHFKYDLFCQPGDVHIHLFGTSVLSFGDGIETKDGDLFEIEADCFAHPLRNRLETGS